MNLGESSLDSYDHESPSPEIFYVGGNRNGPRSKAGCWTCRLKKVKCDEVRPVCHRCVRLERECDYSPRQRKKCGPRRLKHGGSNSPVPSMDLENDRFYSPGAAIPSAALAAPLDAGARRKIDQNKGCYHPSENALKVSQLSPPSLSAACSLVLSPNDHESIQHFRTSFAIRQHTKNPKYSVLSIIFRLAESSPMVMHMVTAIAGQEIVYLKCGNDITENLGPAEHYGEAMKMMADGFKEAGTGSDVDSILATLWLMIQYEQRFGDGHGMGLKSHLDGLAAILTNTYPALTDLYGPSRNIVAPDLTALRSTQDDGVQRPALSTFVTRMILWLANFDASAATYGLGGQVNNSLAKLIREVNDEDDKNPIKGYFKIHQHSNSLFRTVWGDAYPQSELLDDIENRDVFYLLSECGQLRYMVAELASCLLHSKTGAEQQIQAVERAIRLVGRKHSEILRIATSLTSDDNNHKRLASNIRFIVPNFHATVLQFLRVTRFQEPLDERQRLSLREIMTLAFKSFKHEGDVAMLRITWPLFMAGLETDDLLHKEWILERFRSLGKFGMNYKRAFYLLEALIDEQERLGERVNMLDLLDSGCYEKFVV